MGHSLDAFQPSRLCVGHSGVDLSDLFLVPRMRRIQRHSVETHAELLRLCALLGQCLAAVTRLAQALPVATIPEPPEISAVWLDVIHLCG